MRYLVLLLLAGCAAPSDMVKVAEPKTVVVTWERERPTHCGEHKVGTGCTRTSYTFDRCTIWAGEDVSDEVLGHELRHCFGWLHEAQAKRRAQK